MTGSYTLIDTHTHLYLRHFQQDITQVIERAENEGVAKFFLPAIDSTETENLLALEARFPQKCIAMMGVHPCSINENYQKELQEAEAWLQKRPFVAIGEIGLDFYWDKTYVKEQYEAFTLQMEWALQLNLPIVIHTRNAIPEAIKTVAPFAAKGVKGIFHCFGGTLEEARQITSMDFCLGIGGVLTYKNSGLDAVLKEIPMEYIVLETDAPYLSPVPFRGKRNESSYLKYVAEKLAEVKTCSVATVAEATTANARRVFHRSNWED